MRVPRLHALPWHTLELMRMRFCQLFVMVLPVTFCEGPNQNLLKEVFSTKSREPLTILFVPTI